jgi:antitoxin component YwqK of YwqJK toxin-antitoxin module
MRRPALWLLPVSLALVSTSAALPPGEARFREGANHRVGDDSFVERYGRTPGEADDEAIRMRVHLEHARTRLAAAPPTRPELTARRAELLGYLGEYIAKGTTPINTRLPWRSPVFIDDFGNICAVGYLIERSAGRALPEQIAARHRFDYLEDIADAMPEVRAWIESSGLTVGELASIQPGYEAPMVEQWSPWHLAGKVGPRDGAYRNEIEYTGIVTRGAFRRRQMQGEWTRVDAKGRVLGKGQMASGAGTWRSYDRDGKKLAEGPYAASLPHGAWAFYHPSGHLAAEGRFERGVRSGAWRFYYDTAARTPIAAGGFDKGSIRGRWEHFDAGGRLVAVSSESTPSQWEYTAGGHLLVVTPYASGVRHVVHSGNIMASDWRLDGFFKGDEQIYVHDHRGRRIFDAHGFELVKVDGAWHAADCGWSKTRKAAAQSGDITTLHGLLYLDGQGESDTGRVCGSAARVSRERARRIDELLATERAVRTPSPEIVKKIASGQWQWPVKELREEEVAGDNEVFTETPPEPPPAPKTAEELEDDARSAAQSADLTKTLATSMGWYLEFPHIDGRFIQVFYTLPGLTPGLRSPEFAEADEGE